MSSSDPATPLDALHRRHTRTTVRLHHGTVIGFATAVMPWPDAPLLDIRPPGLGSGVPSRLVAGVASELGDLSMIAASEPLSLIHI